MCSQCPEESTTEFQILFEMLYVIHVILQTLAKCLILFPDWPSAANQTVTLGYLTLLLWEVKTACKTLSEFKEGHVKQIALSYKFIELQIVWGWKRLQEVCNQCPSSSRVRYSKLLRSMSIQILSVIKLKTSQTFWETCWSVRPHAWEKKNKILVRLNVSSYILACFHCLSLSGDDWEGSGSIFVTFFQCITFLERWMLGKGAIIDYNIRHFHSHGGGLPIPK